MGLVQTSAVSDQIGPITLRSIPPLQPPLPRQSIAPTPAIHIVHSRLRNITGPLPRITQPQSLLIVHTPFLLHVPLPVVSPLLLPQG